MSAGATEQPSDDPLAGVNVYRAAGTYGPYPLAGEQLQQVPAGVIPVNFEEPVWVLGYSTEVEAEVDIPQRELHCHTLLSSSAGAGHPVAGQPFKGFFSDGYTQRIQLPKGYGIYFDTAEALALMPMFNNRSDGKLDASMSIVVDFVLASELPRPLVPLFATAVSIAEPYLYLVPPGGDQRERRFQLPYAGTIHAMGIHIHPYGRTVELINESRGETVWVATGVRGADGRLERSPFYSSDRGYRFGPEDRFVLRATYDNPTEVEQDAMAGLFIFFATDDGKMPEFDAAGGAHQGHGSPTDHAGHPGHSG